MNNSSENKKTFFTAAVTHNPVLMEAVGLAPVIAVASSAKSALLLSVMTALSLFTIYILTNKFLKKFQNYIRMPLYIVIGSLISVATMAFAQKFLPSFHVELGLFLPLTAVNSFVAVHCERFALTGSLKSALIHAGGSFAGYLTVSMIVGIVREILSLGTVFGIECSILPITSNGFTLPFAAFIILGFLAATLKWKLGVKYENENADKAFMAHSVLVETEEHTAPLEIIAKKQKILKKRQAFRKVIVEDKQRKKEEKLRIQQEKEEKLRLEREESERRLAQIRMQEELAILEKERIEAEQREKERLERERIEAERKEKERLEKEAEEKRLAEIHAQREKERLDRERIEAEQKEIERLERERIEAERKEKERLEKVAEEKRLAEIRVQREKERLDRERIEAEQKEIERLERERIEAELKEKERLEKEAEEKRLAEIRVQREKERLDRERIEAEQKEIERLKKEEEKRIQAELKAKRDEEKRRLIEQKQLENIEKRRKEKEMHDIQKAIKAQEKQRKKSMTMDEKIREKALAEEEKRRRKIAKNADNGDEIIEKFNRDAAAAKQAAQRKKVDYFDLGYIPDGMEDAVRTAEKFNPYVMPLSEDKPKGGKK